MVLSVTPAPLSAFLPIAMICATSGIGCTVEPMSRPTLFSAASALAFCSWPGKKPLPQHSEQLQSNSDCGE